MDASDALGAFGAIGGSLILAAIVIVAFVLLLLAILMPLFVYQIRVAAHETLTELRTLNTNLGRFLAVTRPDAPPSTLATAQSAKPARPTPPTMSNLDEAAKFYGVQNAHDK